MKLKKMIAVMMSAALVLGLSACGGGQKQEGAGGSGGDQNAPAENQEEGSAGGEEQADQAGADSQGGTLIEVTIPHYKTGENVGATFFLPQVERFNQKYEGKYHITIEEITQDVYPEKIKQLGQQGKLPVLIEGGETKWMEEVVIPNEMFYDLKEFVDSHPDIKNVISEEAYNYNLYDGKLVTLMTPIMFPISMYYNETLWNPSKPVGEMSWEEVAQDLGDAQIAFMTGENAWTTMLTLSSLIAVEPGGAELLRDGVDDKIMDFSQKPIVDAVTKLQDLMQNHGIPATVGAAYADAANAFYSNNAAVMPNGSWMVPDFAPESADKWSNGFDPEKIHGAIMPGNVAMANARGYCYWIPATASDEEVELVLAFLEFIYSPEELEASMLALGGMIPGFEHSEEFLAKRADDRIMDEYMSSVQADTIIVPAFADAIPSSVANTEFGKLLPKLVDGSFTPEQFCEELTKKAAETALE
ncbi:MAG: carbohydrate ABC transporter substrate-binding protein [Lachnospiraceae bacterium]|nr:carbohydrate ABC transporter substrate-binding protein [Lachnospiraceae bacterium]